MKSKSAANQLSLFDIVTPQAVPDEAKETATPHPSCARVPDEEYNSPPIAGLPTVDSILKKMQRASVKTSLYELLSATIECGAIAISNQFDRVQAPQREEQYRQTMKRFDPDTRMLIQDVFGDIAALLMNMINPHVGFRDYLGELFMRSETSSNKAGQFFTPYSVSKMCAQVAINENKVNEAIAQDKILTLNEPTCGAGGMILAAADVLYNQYHFNIARNLFVICSDVDARCVYMTYLQLSLAGIPAVVYQQNTLTLETWQCWETPTYIMQYTRFRDVFRREAENG